jgi:hypothetical protein
MEVIPVKLTTNFKMDDCPLSPINILIGCRAQCSRRSTVIWNAPFDGETLWSTIAGGKPPIK